MPRGNVAINRERAKEVKDGIVYQVLPEIEHEGQMCPSFTTVSPTKCQICGNNLETFYFLLIELITSQRLSEKYLKSA